jgi:hypothetical protein
MTHRGSWVIHLMRYVLQCIVQHTDSVLGSVCIALYTELKLELRTDWLI